MDPIAFYHSRNHDVNYRFTALATLFNQMIDLPLDAPALDELLDELGERFGPQFSFETQLMTECRYPRRVPQEAAHVNLWRQLRMLQETDRADPRLPAARKTFLKALEKHLALEDNDLIKYLNACVMPVGREITTTIIRRPSDSEGRLVAAGT